MTPEEQRIAIAEACGWRMVEGLRAFPSVEWVKARVPPEVFEQLTCVDHMVIPDYLNDLNACAAFEATLKAESRVGDSDSSFARYIGELGKICGKCKNEEINSVVTVWEAFAYSVTATALQRCLAFLAVRARKET